MAQPTLELSMIVKNGAAGLRRCLESIHGIVDRIVVGDTGSTDQTADIAREFGAEVISVPWEDDFSRARNYVLAQARCDWILFLDSDEMLDPSARTILPALLADASVSGYDIWAWNYVRDLDFRCGGEQAIANPVRIEEARPYPAYFKSFHTRLFRRHPAIYFEHCVHETVADRLDALSLTRRPGHFIFHHFGFAEDATEKRQEKNNLYYQLASRKLSSAVNTYQANLEFGISELDHAKLPAFALPHFELACAFEPQRFLAWLYAGICLGRLNRHAEAIERLNHAVRLDPSNSLAHTTLGDVYTYMASYAQARDAYLRARRLGDQSSLTCAKLGAAQVRLGERESGLATIQQAIVQNPSAAELYEILAGAALLAGRPAVACQAAEHRLTLESLTGFPYLLAATIHLHADQPARAAAILRDGAQRFPYNAEIQDMAQSLV